MTGHERFRSYWNDEDVVGEFAMMSPSPYWEEYLQSKQCTSARRVLDLGCGAGRNTLVAIRLGFEAYAVDLHDAMVRKTKDRARTCGAMAHADIDSRILLADMSSLPFDDEFFDVIVANGVYHNVTTKQEFVAAVGESVRVLRRDGDLCLNMFTSSTIDPGVKPSEARDIYTTPDGLPMLLMSASAIMGIMKRLGLSARSEIEEYETVVQTGKRAVLRTVLGKT